VFKELWNSQILGYSPQDKCVDPELSEYYCKWYIPEGESGDAVRKALKRALHFIVFPSLTLRIKKQHWWCNIDYLQQFDVVISCFQGVPKLI